MTTKHIFKQLTLALVATSLLVACGPKRQEEVDRIAEMEQVLSEAGYVVNDSLGHEMIALYNQFVAHFPQDSLSPIYLFRASDIALSINDYEQSIASLNQLIEDYPDFDQVSTCYFLRGNAYDEAGQLDKAAEAYTEFIERYPDHPLNESAQVALRYLGKSPEEMLELILSSTTAANLEEE